MKAKMILNELDYYIPEQIINQLDKAKIKVLNSNQDRVYVIDGREGSGKSRLAKQLAYFFDRKLSLKNIVFNSKDFEDRIRNAPKHSAIIYDEAFSGLSSKGALSKENKKLVRLLQECRQRGHFIFIVLPSYFILEKYVALFRATALFHVGFSKKNFKLRFYKVYNYNDKLKLYIQGKHLFDYSKPNVFKKYRFYAKVPKTIDIKAYERKKQVSFYAKEKEEAEETSQIMQRNFLLYHFNKNHEYSFVKLAKLLKDAGFSLNESVIGRIIRKYPEKRHKT